jgi:hypothetical protein
MKKLGRTQAIAVGTFLFPFAAATAAMFRGDMTASEWTATVQWLVPSVLVPLTGFGALVKTKESEK